MRQDGVLVNLVQQIYIGADCQISCSLINVAVNEQQASCLVKSKIAVSFHPYPFVFAASAALKLNSESVVSRAQLIFLFSSGG